MGKMIKLNEKDLSFYENQGYLIVHNLLDLEEINLFLEYQKYRGTNDKLGLLRHTIDPEWEYIAKHKNIAGVVAQIYNATPYILQTMYLPKKAGQKRSGIALHQDTHYLPNDPNTLMACWVALSDTDGENGGLCVVPGSHKEKLFSTHQNISDVHDSWEIEYLMRDRDGKEWNQKFFSFEIDGIEKMEIKKLTVPKGSGVFFSGMTIHGSYANTSPKHDRLAFATHYVKAGTWILRADVQETVAVTKYSK
jgi:ectoine hydroxylase-related dioxygenase (phytanoyl-CoA dioxygenase family)